MSNYEFFTSCLKTAQDKYKELLKTPRARGGNLQDEIKEIKEKIRRAVWYEELTEDESKELIDKFDKIDFNNLSKDRAAIKEREKYNVGNRNYS